MDYPQNPCRAQGRPGPPVPRTPGRRSHQVNRRHLPRAACHHLNRSCLEDREPPVLIRSKRPRPRHCHPDTPPTGRKAAHTPHSTCRNGGRSSGNPAPGSRPPTQPRPTETRLKRAGRPGSGPMRGFAPAPDPRVGRRAAEPPAPRNPAQTGRATRLGTDGWFRSGPRHARGPTHGRTPGPPNPQSPEPPAARSPGPPFFRFTAAPGPPESPLLPGRSGCAARVWTSRREALIRPSPH